MATWNSDGSPSNIQTLHDSSASDGDIITLPSGTFTWTSGITITKAIILQGNGVGNTIVKDNISGSTKLMQWTLVAAKPSRLTAIEFQDGGRTPIALAPGGLFHVDGSNTNGSTFRWDNCKWDSLNGFAVFDTVIGVIDHNTFVQNNSSAAIGVYVYGTNWDGVPYGDGAWAAATNFGGSNFLFFENNSFTHTGAYLGAVTDGFAGARFVVRYNNPLKDTIIANHGTESDGRNRGARALECYNNTFTGTDVNNFIGGIRSGPMLLHDNTISGYQGNLAHFTLVNYRHIFSFPPWGGADGTNAWDANNATGVFASGTANGASSGQTVTANGSPGWTTDQWIGYTIRRTTNLGGLSTSTFSAIMANTANTITYNDTGGFGTALAFSNGDSFEIRLVDHALDQPGRAGGSLVSGATPSPPGGWNDQVTEKCYSWSNTITDGSPGAKANYSAWSWISTAHYANDTVFSYTPYTYPHPLVTGGPTPSPGHGKKPIITRRRQ